LSGLLLPAMFISALDQTVMATALPTISGDLGRLSIQAGPDRIRALSATVQHGVQDDEESYRGEDRTCANVHYGRTDH
jgi:hypothetical protein